MKRRYRSILFVLVACLLAASLATPSFAAGKTGKGMADHDVATIWVFWPKKGQAKAFVESLKKHVAWRKGAGDPFAWHVYQPVVGSDLDFYVVRSGHHTWADMDTEDAWGQKTEAGKQFMQDVGVHIRKMQHFFGVADTKLSHWIDSKDYRYYVSSRYRFKPGHGADVKDVMKRVHDAATRQHWPYSFDFEYHVGGSGGMSIIMPMKNWAGMAEPSPTLMQVMTKALGSKKAAEKLFTKWDTAIKAHTKTIYAYRADLSTP
jgi:hypothetical protein